MPDQQDEPTMPTEPGRPEPDDQQAAGRRRLRHALMRPTRGQITVAVLLALVGFGAVTQVHTNQVDDTYAGLRQQDLIDVLNGLAGTTQRAQAEIGRLEETRDELLSETTARQAAIDQAQQDAENLSIIAGIVAVQGPGVRITIKEVSGSVEIGPFIDLVQAMRTAGAEGMQVNGRVRVVAQTSFEDAEGGTRVDGRLVTAPYVVDVIGDPDALSAALRFPDGPEDQFAEDDIAELTFKQLDTLTIEAIRDLSEATYAQPAPGQ